MAGYPLRTNVIRSWGGRRESRTSTTWSEMGRSATGGGRRHTESGRLDAYEEARGGSLSVRRRLFLRAVTGETSHHRAGERGVGEVSDEFLEGLSNM